MLTMPKEKAKDAGLALALIFLLAALKFGHMQLVGAAAGILLLCMIVPRLFTPFGWLWYGLAHLLGPIMSKILLTLIYLIVVVPVGWIRRITGVDPMARKQWRQKRESVFIDRGNTFCRTDLDHPY